MKRKARVCFDDDLPYMDDPPEESSPDYVLPAMPQPSADPNQTKLIELITKLNSVSAELAMLVSQPKIDLSRLTNKVDLRAAVDVAAAVVAFVAVVGMLFLRQSRFLSVSLPPLSIFLCIYPLTISACSIICLSLFLFKI